MSRKIALVSATEFEIKPLVDYLQANASILGPNQFEIQNLQIDIVYSGIGTLHTTYHLMNYLMENHPDGWMQIGIGGTLDNALKIGDVFQIESEMIFGEGAQQNDGTLLNPFTLGWIDKNSKPFTNELLICPYATSLAFATGMTTFYAHGETTAIQQLKKHVHGQIENLEGAPFFYISLLKKIPFLSLRSISNYVEARDTFKWNIPLAIEQLNTMVIRLLEDTKFHVPELFKLRID